MPQHNTQINNTTKVVIQNNIYNKYYNNNKNCSLQSTFIPYKLNFQSIINSYANKTIDCYKEINNINNIYLTINNYKNNTNNDIFYFVIFIFILINVVCLILQIKKCNENNENNQNIYENIDYVLDSDSDLKNKHIDTDSESDSELDSEHIPIIIQI